MNLRNQNSECKNQQIENAPGGLANPPEILGIVNLKRAFPSISGKLSIC